MTLPNLTPCPKPDCRAPITHWHDGAGNVFACYIAMRGEPCTHGDQGNPCHAPRETTPLLVPDVDAVARVIYESEHDSRWDDEMDGIKDAYRSAAQVALDLIAAHQHVWQRVEPGTLIKAGTRYRRVCADGSSYERIAASDFLSDNGNISIDPRTVPAPTLTERIRAALNDSPESRITLDVADVEALLDMVGGDQS